MYKYFDIECNGLSPDKVWCIVVNDKRYDKDNIEAALADLSTGTLVGHNIIDFDLPVLNKLYGFECSLDNVIDTAILSRLYKCDRHGGHSLAAWGERLGVAKLPDLDWETYSHAMLERCAVDVKITKLTHERLMAEAGSHDWKQAIWIEQHIAHYHQRQRNNGVQLDITKVHQIADELEGELQHVHDTIAKYMPPVINHNPNPTKPFIKSGGYSSATENWYGEDVCDVCGMYTKIDIQPFNIRSDKQVKAFLYSIGWEPDEWNYKKDKSGKFHRPLIKTSPKLSDSSLEPLGEVGEMFMKKGMLQHRLSMLRNKDGVRGLVYRARADGRVEAGGIPMGTPTGRYTHSGVVNIPDNEKPYGEAIRSCFIAAEGKVLLGSDADSLEVNMEASYTFPFDGGKYAKLLTEGKKEDGTDVHTMNAKLWGVPYKVAKGGKFCVTYGGQAAKLAETLGILKKLGKRYFDNFWNGSPALKALRDAVKGALGKGYLLGIDGRKLFVRSEHSALNMLFQSAGSITVKLATILMNQRMDAAGLDWKQVLHMHDEFLIELWPDDVEAAKEIIQQCWIDAGKMLGLKVPITGSCKVGKSWGVCH